MIQYCRLVMKKSVLDSSLRFNPLIWETASPRNHMPKIVNASLNSILFHRNVLHYVHYHNCTNGLVALNKKAARAMNKKYL